VVTIVVVTIVVVTIVVVTISHKDCKPQDTPNLWH